MASQEAADKQAMPPPAPRLAGAKRRVVLEEDTYAEAIEAIVERDFFPHLPKLQNQLEWLQAVQSGDPAQIKRAQLNIARRRAGLKTPLAHEAPATSAITPGTGLLRTPAMTPAVGGPTATAAAAAATPGGFGCTPAAATPGRTPAAVAAASALEQQGLDPVAAQQQVGAKAPSLSLDQFFSSYQGEDNASFQQLQVKAIERKRAKMVHHLEDKNKPLLLEAGHEETDEYGTSGQAPSSLQMTKHVPKNALYYDTSQRPALALTAAEAATIVQGAPKVINYVGTRSLRQAQEAAGGSSSAVDAMGEARSSKLAAAVVAPGTSGYGYMRTPQLLPGVEASPLMTWGDIASTPLRLDGTAAAAGGDGADLLELQALEELVADAEAGASGRQFSMPEVRSRETAARAMLAGRTAVAANRRRGGAGGSTGSATPLLDALRRGGTGGTTPGRAAGPGGATPGGPTRSGVSLSAAGLKLAQQLKGGARPGTGMRPTGAAAAAASTSGLAGAADLQLRASYKGGVTPSRSGAAVPGRWGSTPSTGMRGPGSSSLRTTAGASSQRQQHDSSTIKVSQKQAGAGSSRQHTQQPRQQQQQQQQVSGSITDDLLQLG